MSDFIISISCFLNYLLLVFAKKIANYNALEAVRRYKTSRSLQKNGINLHRIVEKRIGLICMTSPLIDVILKKLLKINSIFALSILFSLFVILFSYFIWAIRISVSVSTLKTKRISDESIGICFNNWKSDLNSFDWKYFVHVRIFIFFSFFCSELFSQVNNSFLSTTHTKNYQPRISRETQWHEFKSGITNKNKSRCLRWFVKPKPKITWPQWRFKLKNFLFETILFFFPLYIKLGCSWYYTNFISRKIWLILFVTAQSFAQWNK